MTLPRTTSSHCFRTLVHGRSGADMDVKASIRMEGVHVSPSLSPNTFHQDAFQMLSLVCHVRLYA